MEQIYYTQCPLGYGLGASNGYQVKRISPGYPPSADFRHLGLRAFVAGSRQLAPNALRYRREGDVAEIAWLVPRDREFETEKGRWGRPGGHFAHGLRLDRKEMRHIADWPAGLFDAACWKRSDPEPSRGRPPDPLEVSIESLAIRPEFAGLARIAGDLDPEFLAGLLAAAASAVREGRTLYLIGDAAEVARTIALITFAFPEKTRADLTFSSYNDRPDELSGFRIQGLPALASLNRASLASSGPVADLKARSVEPADDPPSWATTLAGWFATGDAKAWDWYCEHMRRVRIVEGESPWSDSWLDPALRLGSLLGAADSTPRTIEGWDLMASLAGWSGVHWLGEEWARAFPPSWWLSRGPHAELAAARAAFRETLRLPTSWDSSRVVAWGKAVGEWSGGRSRNDRQGAIAAAWKGVSKPDRARFLKVCLLAFPPAESGEILAWLAASPTVDQTLIAPLEARQAARNARIDQDYGEVDRILRRSAADALTLATALEAMTAIFDGDTEAIAPASRILASVLDELPGDVGAGVEDWALRREDGGAWLESRLRDLFADPHKQDDWDALRDRTAPALRPSLAAIVLRIAADPTLPDEAFGWGVEGLLLPIPEDDRPRGSSWAETYLRRTPSGLALFRKLYVEPVRGTLKPWLAEAGRRDEISDEQAHRLRQIREFARVLASKDAAALLDTPLPDVFPEDRGTLLGQMLHHFRQAGPGLMDVCLDSCRIAWPGAFEPGTPGLGGLAKPVAQALAPLRTFPENWLATLRQILGRLGLDRGPALGFEPHGFAAEVVAATHRTEERADLAWTLRQRLFLDERAWKILAVDAKGAIDLPRPGLALEAFDDWDAHLDKRGRSDRFFELTLNVCRPTALAAIVAAKVRDLMTLRPISWWRAGEIPGAADDLRDAFARLAPIDPLPEQSLAHLQNWLRRKPPPEAEGVSPQGQRRWQCLSALSAFSRSGIDAVGRWGILRSWIGSLPLGALSEPERYRLIAGVIRLLEDSDAAVIAELAPWLVREGVNDARRVMDWADLLGDVPGFIQVARVAMVGDLAGAIRREASGVLRRG